MKRILVYLLLFCFANVMNAQQTIDASITHDNLQRDYILYVPASYSGDEAVPLILNFHGYTSNAMEQMFYGDFRSIADTAGFLVVHPMGTEDLLGNTHWNVGWGASSVDDVGFTAALIDSLASQYAIDDQRIYSTGMSNGGFMSYRLACELSDRIAAIASVTGSMTNGTTNNCNASHPTPVMDIHGTEDDVVAYTGSFLFAPVEEVLSYWVDFNNCDTDATITNLEDTDTDDASTVEHQVFSNGDNGVVVEHYKVIGGGHTWPGAAFSIGVTNFDMDASKEIWRFFSQYDINGSINNTTSVKPVLKDLVQVKIYPNPSSSFIVVEQEFRTTVNYELTNMVGQSIRSGVLNSNKHRLDISNLANGVYLLKLDNRVFKIFKNG